MRVYHISQMRGGWFVGDFHPAAFQTRAAEVALHVYTAGDTAEPHFHKKATEINLLVRGEMVVNGTILRPGSVFVFEPGEISRVDFTWDSELVVVKVPSVPGDKYLAEKETVNG